MSAQEPTPNPPNPVPQPSGTTPLYFNSPKRIITAAMRNAGYLDRDQDPDSGDYAEYMPRLQDYINYLQTQGLKLWLQEDVAISLTQGVNLYSFGPAGTVTMPRPPRFLEGYWQDNFGNRRPLIPLSRNEWDTLSTLVQQGSINSYFADKQQLVTNLYVWLTPDLWTQDNGQVHMLTQVAVNGLVTLVDTMNFPTEWYIALHWGFGEEISVGQPMAIQAKCAQMAEKYRAALEGWDVEDASTMFQPDQRTSFVSQRFRY